MPAPHLDPKSEQHLLALATNLYTAIEGGDPAHILAAQQPFSQAVEALWQRIDHADIPEKDKAIARLLSNMALKDLPQLIQDPANYPEILREMRLLKNSLILLE